MEKTITLRNTEITFSIWDLGGHREFLSMLPLVCNDARAILFMFDLSRKSTLTSVKEWYGRPRGNLARVGSDVATRLREDDARGLTPQKRAGTVFVRSRSGSCARRYRQCRGLNRTAFALLVGTKYDSFVALPPEEQEDIDREARRFARAMKAPLIFTSAHESINVMKLFKVILSRVFDIKCTLPHLTEVGEPLLIF